MKQQILDSPFYVTHLGTVLNSEGNEVTYYINEKDYRRVCLVWNNKRKWLKVSRLVAIAFIPNPLNKETVNHINGNRKDDNVTNLEWNSWSENIKHSFDKLGRKPSGGLNIERREPLQQFDKLNNLVATFESINDAARKTKISLSNISLALNKKRKSAGGYIWKKCGHFH